MVFPDEDSIHPMGGSARWYAKFIPSLYYRV